MTPTQRSLALLRKTGYRVAITEHWNAHAHCRQDLFGFVDLIAICPTEKPLAIQTTTRGNANARVEKILALPVTVDVLKGGFAIHVHGWVGKDVWIQEILLDPDGKTLRVI